MEDFVNFSIAKKLKEKGFREPCLGWYYPFEVCGFDYKTSIVFNNSAYRGSNYKDMLVSHKDEKYIDVPTISQVLKWLREEKKIHIEPCILADADTDADGKVINEFTYWSFSIMSIATGDMIYFEYEHIDDKRFNSCEEAALAGIKYVLDNLI